MQQLAPSPSQQEWTSHGLWSLCAIMERVSLRQFQRLERMQATLRSALRIDATPQTGWAPPYSGPALGWSPPNRLVRPNALAALPEGNSKNDMNAAMVKRIVDELISVSREMSLRQSLRNLEVLELRPPKTDREIAIYYDMVGIIYLT